MTLNLLDDGLAQPAIPITAVSAEEALAWRDRQSKRVSAWLDSIGFEAKDGRHALIPGEGGTLERVLLITNGGEGGDGLAPEWAWASLARDLPEGVYRAEPRLAPTRATAAALAWALAAYEFNRYKSAAEEKARAKLVWPEGADRALVERDAASVTLCRDLVNLPADDLGPPQLADAACELARAFGAKPEVIVGDDLLKRDCPAVHAVGRAAARAPRLIDFSWAPEGVSAGAPKVVLVGKGVCFDTGGLDIKPAASMYLMKKDMGGAAHVLAMAKMLMAANLDLRLRVLIPAVENNISGNALRPQDIVTTAKGTTVEIGHTDAEGRVILADALWRAMADAPDLIIDFATLTGAARTALGTELPALFCNDDGLAEDILAAGKRTGDPLWRLPLWDGYRHMVEGEWADITNAPQAGYAGAITAALFLENFVTPETGAAPPWAHVDVMAWNVRARPGRPKGGEAMGARAMVEMIRKRFSL